jgi:hypothetical protein
LFFLLSKLSPAKGTCYNPFWKMLPQPQQQPNKTQTTTQQQKPTHHKPTKKAHTQKNPQQQPKLKSLQKFNLRTHSIIITCP